MNAAQISRPRYLLTLLALSLALLGGQSCALYEDMAPLQQPTGVHELKISPNPARVELGQSAQLSASALDRRGQPVADVELSWTSNNPEIAQVDPAGLVRAEAIGKATITASADGVSASTSVEVFSAVKRIEIDPPTVTLSVGTNEQLSAQLFDEDDELLSARAVDWSSSDEQIVTVDSHGQITGVAQGEASVRARSGGVTGTARVKVKEPVARVDISPDEATIDVTEVIELSAEVFDTSDQVDRDRVVSWSSSREEVAQVSDNGVVTGLSEGSTTITAASGGEQGQARITVSASVYDIQISPNPAEVPIDQNLRLNAAVLDRAENPLSGRAIAWESVDPDIATVDQDGRVFGEAPGRTQIRASADGHTSSVRLDVTEPVEQVKISPSSLSLELDQREQLNVTLTNSRGEQLSGRSVSWQSSASDIVSVDADGQLTAHQIGSAEISATSEEKSDEITVTVENIIRSFQVTPAELSVEVTDVDFLSAVAKNIRGDEIPDVDVNWSSSEPLRVAVDQDGSVMGVAGGSATITARAQGFEDTSEVTVEDPVRSVQIDSHQPTLEITRTMQLSAQLEDKGGNPITGRPIQWTSSKPEVAQVNESTGKITATGAGQATITAEAELGADDTTITVEAPPYSLSISPDPVSISVGNSETLTAAVLDRAGNTLSGHSISWESDTPNIVSVTPASDPTQATITALAGGSATITASLQSSGSALSADLTVSTGPPVASVELNPPTVALFPAENAQFDADLKDSNHNAISGRSITWAVDDTAVATVDSDGLITAHSPGTTQLRATSEGQEGSAQIDVLRWEYISARQGYSCGVTSDGSGYCWGGNTIGGALGDGTYDSGPEETDLNHDADRDRPTAVDTSVKFQLINAGFFHTCGLSTAGKAYCWGNTSSGRLGNGESGQGKRPTPVAVDGNYTFVDIQPGANHTCALDDRERVYCWGYNVDGQAGQGEGSAVIFSAPQRVSSHSFDALAVGANHTCARRTSGEVLCWGEGSEGQIGNGSTDDQFSPTPISTSQEFSTLAAGFDHTCALTAAGETFCWGEGQRGGIGDGTTTKRPTPVATDTNERFEKLAAGGGSTCGITEDGDGYCWGFNGQGNLGNGSSAGSPQTNVRPMSGGYQWQTLSLGLMHSCGVTADTGEAYCWGRNQRGELGVGAPGDYRTTPRAILNP